MLEYVALTRPSEVVNSERSQNRTTEVVSQLLGGVAPLLGSSAISSHLISLGYPQKSLDSMLKCGQETNQKIIVSCECGVRALTLSHHCNLRTCPNCSHIRKKRIRKNYLPFLMKYSTNARRSDFLYFLTISPKNYENFSEGLVHIRKSFSKFLRNKYIKERIKGGFYVIESKKLEKGWNIHIHALVYGRYIDNKIRGKCFECGQNLLKYNYHTQKHYCSNRLCNSTNVLFKQNSKIVDLWNKCSQSPVNIQVSRCSSQAFALNYMLKYVSTNKDCFQSDQDCAEYIYHTRKQKLITKFGIFFDMKIPKMPVICPCCQKEVSFCFDMEYIRLIESQTKPPPDLSFYVEN